MARRARPRRAQSACRGTVHGGLPAVNPWQGVHHKLPQPMVHSPESHSSKRGRRATTPELNVGEGVAFLVQEVAQKIMEALGPTYGERGGVRWLGIDGAAESRGGCGGDGLPKADIARVQMRCRGHLLL
jgi:hypothetical protein